MQPPSSAVPIPAGATPDTALWRTRVQELMDRRGFLGSAADEWIAVAETAPDCRAMLGLAKVALAQGLPEDAAAFAEEAVALDPSSTDARALRSAIASKLLQAS